VKYSFAKNAMDVSVTQSMFYSLLFPVPYLKPLCHTMRFLKHHMLNGAFDVLNNLVKTLEKPGPIPLLKRRWATHYGSCFAKFGQEVSSCQHLPNVDVGQDTPGWAKNLCTAFDAPICQRGVRCYHNIIFGNMLDDPVIGRVKLTFNDNQFRQFLIRNSHR
jgi:hypothetical protein